MWWGRRRGDETYTYMCMKAEEKWREKKIKFARRERRFHEVRPKITPLCCRALFSARKMQMGFFTRRENKNGRETEESK